MWEDQRLAREVNDCYHCRKRCCLNVYFDGVMRPWRRDPLPPARCPDYLARLIPVVGHIVY